MMMVINKRLKETIPNGAALTLKKRKGREIIRKREMKVGSHFRSAGLL